LTQVRVPCPAEGCGKRYKTSSHVKRHMELLVKKGPGEHLYGEHKAALKAIIASKDPTADLSSDASTAPSIRELGVNRTMRGATSLQTIFDGAGTALRQDATRMVTVPDVLEDQYRAAVAPLPQHSLPWCSDLLPVSPVSEATQDHQGNNEPLGQTWCDLMTPTGTESSPDRAMDFMSMQSQADLQTGVDAVGAGTRDDFTNQGTDPQFYFGPQLAMEELGWLDMFVPLNQGGATATYSCECSTYTNRTAQPDREEGGQRG